MRNYPPGAATYMNQSQWSDYLSMRERHPSHQPRPIYRAAPIFDACNQLRTWAYGTDRNLWPARTRYREIDVDSLDGVPFVTLIEAARRCASEADAEIIEAAFKPRGE